MIRIILIVLLIYLIFRFIRNISVFTARSGHARGKDREQPPSTPKQTKIIKKNEGEYVDYEEVKE